MHEVTTSKPGLPSDIPHHVPFVAGRWLETPPGGFIDDRNPATGEVFARVGQCGAAEVRAAVDAAARVQREWDAMVAADKEAVFLRAATILETRRQEFVSVLVDESGSVFGKAMFETAYVMDLLRSAAGLVRRERGDVLPLTQPGQFGMSVRRPLGVIAGISPFNAPFLLAMKKVVFALAAGNGFVLKPSEETPVIGLMIGQLFQEAGLPAGLLSVVTGPAKEIGEALMADPRVRMITFTGSTRVGKLLAVEAARHMKRITLELGGKSPLIVLKDADLDYAARAAAFGIFFHQGQVCMATSRVIVEEPVREAFSERLARIAQSIKVGSPREHDTVIGPLIRASQCDVIDQQIEAARAGGAQLLTGGRHEGSFYQPTVLTAVNESMGIFHDESFGPITSVIGAADSEEALRLANETSYGLSSGVITNDMQKAFDIALRLDAGMVHINDTTVLDEPHVPFGGIKNSGVGREGGRWSLDEMSEVKWITLQMGQRQFFI